MCFLLDKGKGLEVYTPTGIVQRTEEREGLLNPG